MKTTDVDAYFEALRNRDKAGIVHAPKPVTPTIGLRMAQQVMRRVGEGMH